MSAKGGPFFTFRLPLGQLVPCPRHLRHWM